MWCCMALPRQGCPSFAWFGYRTTTQCSSLLARVCMRMHQGSWRLSFIACSVWSNKWKLQSSPKEIIFIQVLGISFYNLQIQNLSFFSNHIQWLKFITTPQYNFFFKNNCHNTRCSCYSRCPEVQILAKAHTLSRSTYTVYSSATHFSAHQTTILTQSESRYTSSPWFSQY